MWIPPELKDPVCYHAPTRKSISYFGAVRLAEWARPNATLRRLCALI